MGAGVRRRFGLVYVDYPTLARVPKDSFGWYARLIESTRRSASQPKTAVGAEASRTLAQAS
jgi:beta-glucosidase